MQFARLATQRKLSRFGVGRGTFKTSRKGFGMYGRILLTLACCNAILADAALRASDHEIHGFNAWEASRLEILLPSTRASVKPGPPANYAEIKAACREAFDRKDRAAVLAGASRLVDTDDTNAQIYASRILSALQRDRRVTPIALRLLLSENEYVRDSFYRFFDLKADARDLLLRRLSDAKTAEEAIEHLRQFTRFAFRLQLSEVVYNETMKLDHRSIAAIASHLDSEKRDLRQASAAALVSVGTGARGALPIVWERLPKETDPEIRTDLTRAITQIGREDKRSVKLLMHEARNDPSWQAIGSLGRVEVLKSEAAATLVDVMHKVKEERKKCSAIEQIGRLAYASPDVGQFLEGIIRDERLSDELRRTAIAALGASPSQDLIPVDTLEATYIGGNLFIRRAILEVLPRAVPADSALQFLEKHGLNDSEKEIELTALASLTELGDAASRFRPQLESKLRGERRMSVKIATIKAIQAMQPKVDYGDALYEMLTAFKRTKTSVIYGTQEEKNLEALIVLIAQQNHNEKLNREVLRLLHDKNQTVRLAAIEVLERNGSLADANVREQIRDLIDDDDWRVSYRAFVAIHDASPTE